MIFHMIPVCQKAKGITRNMVMPRPDLPYYMLNTLTKATIPYKYAEYASR